MCGVAGFLEIVPRSTGEELEVIALGMAATLHHRGPDDLGVWSDPAAGIALAHRRLSILDLSPLGHQPMHSRSGRFVVTFNGEIYNFVELRKQLEERGHSFRGHSDTEVLLGCVEEFGILQAARRLNGMFAFALWDRWERQLYLVRDRLGEKPLFYGWFGKSFVFGSELKALIAHPVVDCSLNRNALALFLRHNYIPAPYSIYNGIRKVLPGSILQVCPEECGQELSPMKYWSVASAAEEGRTGPFEGSESEALAHLDTLMGDAVKLRMQADVPFGAFLSGGIDSSLVVALMQAQSIRPIRTFTIGFHEAHYNEAEHARAVARHLGTEHTELYVSSKEAMAVIPRLSRLYDEPFSDSSQIPTFLVSQLAKRDVTVCLSGDGGDELFGGYDRYLAGARIWQLMQRIPKGMRTLIAQSLASLMPHQWNAVVGSVARLLPGQTWRHNPGEKMHRIAGALNLEAPEALYLKMVSHWEDPATIVLGAEELPTVLTDARQWLQQWPQLEAFESRMMYLDSMSYLPDDILVKVDRASMGVSLEVRAPFLDHRVVEMSWKLPLGMKIRNGRGKWLLRQILKQYVPQPLIDRPKMGFGVPIDEWLRGPLRAWAEGLLDTKRLKAEGLFDPKPIRKKWDEHLSGEGSWHFHLWDILMFQSWLECQRHSAQVGVTNPCS